MNISKLNWERQNKQHKTDRTKLALHSQPTWDCNVDLRLTEKIWGVIIIVIIISAWKDDRTASNNCCLFLSQYTQCTTLSVIRPSVTLSFSWSFLVNFPSNIIFNIILCLSIVSKCLAIFLNIFTPEYYLCSFLMKIKIQICTDQSYFQFPCLTFVFLCYIAARVYLMLDTGLSNAKLIS